MEKTIKARFSKGMIEPLEEIKIEEGKEIIVTILEISEPEKEKEDPLEITFGNWANLIDCEELKKNIYTARLINTRPEVKL